MKGICTECEELVDINPCGFHTELNATNPRAQAWYPVEHNDPAKNDGTRCPGAKRKI